MNNGATPTIARAVRNIAVGNRNVVCRHSGYGDGAFNVLLTHDSTGPIAIHVDFGIFGTDDDDGD